MAEDKY